MLASRHVLNFIPRAFFCTSNVSLNITDSCANRLSFLRNRDKKDYYLRIILQGGCHGYMYDFKIQDEPINPEEDTVVSREDEKIVVPKNKIDVLQGLTIDYESEMSRKGFVVSHNPNAVNSCGCGKSFTPKQFEGLFS
mmetsp:Transcript_17645/g.30029  ORF Transcript_17645/g.30029 Transcript_17645/m.30029 type:complete len:138 (-) Transcript_17645:11-424(-)